MPTYTYRCTACQEQMMVQQGMNDVKTQVCEHCGGIARVVISNSPGILKTDKQETTKASETPCDHGGSACHLHHKH